MAARKIKKMFTGNPDAPVKSYPPFPGNEGEYLAAQITRISRGATMTIEGLWSVAEDEETGATVIKQKEQGGEDPFEVPHPTPSPLPTHPPLWRQVKKSGEEGLTAPEGGFKAVWVHHPLYPAILTKMGRTSWPVPVLAEGEEEPPEDEDKEEAEPLNKPLDEEVGVGSLDPFTVRLATPVLGDFSPAVLSSTRWLGAHTVALEAHVVNVYCGNGLKYEGSGAFQVVMPPNLPEECSELLPGEEGEPGAPREGMVEQLDEAMPDPFLVVDGTAEGGEEEEA
jgi:hypothetical protein